MKRLLVVGIMSIGITLGVGGFSVSAQSAPLTESQLEQIRVNCQTTKVTLSQLHASDALLRVNRGQLYESMASRMMEPFNTRLANNRQDNKAMTAVTATYRSALDAFRADYQSYERTLSEAIRIDCQQEPALFHATLEDARKKRAVVHTDVQKLHRVISDYRSSVGDFLLNYKEVAS